MMLQTDPVWPWSLVRDGLAAAPAAVSLAVWAAAALAFVLPLLALRLPPGRRGRAAVAGGVILIFLLAFVALYFDWETFFGWTGVGGTVLGRLAGVGLALLIVAPFALLGLTLWTYCGPAAAGRRRSLPLLALRAVAFLLALLAVARPSFAFTGATPGEGGVLLVLIDASQSMTIQDESGKPRWDFLLQTLHDAGPALDRLKDQQHVQVEFSRFADGVEPFSPDNPGAADGRRTDIGGALRRLYETNNSRRLRGVLVLSDGRNNGPPEIDAGKEAVRFARLGCAVHTFGYGNPATPDGQRDVAVATVNPEQPMVPVKGKIRVRATINAPGYVNSKVTVRLALDGKEVTTKNEVPLAKAKDNQVTLECDAPDQAGEVKVTVSVDPLPGELNVRNNTSGTFVSVIKGGINVLLVDKLRGSMEAKLIRRALERDARIQVKQVWLLSEKPRDANVGQLFDFDKQKYDVIIFGDVTPKQVEAVRQTALKEIQNQVDRGSGFLMIGGFKAFGDGGWKDTPIAELLPLDLRVGGQVEQDGPKELKMTPTKQGLQLYSRVLRLSDGDRAAEETAWGNLPSLEGANRLALPSQRGNAIVLAESEETDRRTGEKYPLLVTKDYGGGRVLAFAGDTTARWMNDSEGVRKHDRFWRQMVLWLARQEEGEGQVWVRPDGRSVPAGNDLGFSVGMRSKGGLAVKGGAYTAEVVAPNGDRKPVRIVHDGDEDRGVFRPEAPGEYTIVVGGRGTDAQGETVNEKGEARFVAYEEDIEMARWAADEKFLKDTAEAGRGQYQRGAKLAAFLDQLPAPPEARDRSKGFHLPDWRTATTSPFFVIFYVLFAGVLAGEWFLRRRWGLA
jgi:uncharacterized membrane protein